MVSDDHQITSLANFSKAAVDEADMSVFAHDELGVATRGQRGNVIAAWEECRDIVASRRKRKLCAEVTAGAPMLAQPEVNQGIALFGKTYGYDMLQQEPGPRTVSRIVHAVGGGQLPGSSLSHIKTAQAENASPLPIPASGEAAGVLPPETQSTNITDIAALNDRLWMLYHGIMLAGMKQNVERFQLTWSTVMSHISFITGPEVARRTPPPDIHLVIQGEQALRLEWNRKLARSGTLTLETLMQDPQSNISHWQSHVFIPQQQQQVQASRIEANPWGNADQGSRRMVAVGHAPAPKPTGTQAGGGGKGKKGKGKGKGKDRRFKVCFAYNSQAGCQDQCPRSMDHVCIKCGGNHPRTSPECPMRA